MTKIRTYIVAGTTVSLLAGLLLCGRPMRLARAQPSVGADREADRKAIVESSQAFAKAFKKGDAKAVAEQWTEQGEYSDDRGTQLRGRAAIEKAFAAHFKSKPDAAVETLIEAIRFPAKDLAIEEGILRRGSDGPELPSSSFYRVVHVRENGGWRIAISREWGTGQDRLEDLAWLVGTWKGAVKDKEMSLTFTWDKTKPFMTGSFVTKTKDKLVASGNLKIGFDATKGLLRSWHFDEAGGHGQSLWLRDGNRWVMDSIGANVDGAPTGSINVLTRLGKDEIAWRSIDRVVGGRPLPDTLPIKLTRAPGAGS